jgi:hypothetical protein
VLSSDSLSAKGTPIMVSVFLSISIGVYVIISPLHLLYCETVDFSRLIQSQRSISEQRFTYLFPLFASARAGFYNRVFSIVLADTIMSINCIFKGFPCENDFLQSNLNHENRLFYFLSLARLLNDMRLSRCIINNIRHYDRISCCEFMYKIYSDIYGDIQCHCKCRASIHFVNLPITSFIRSNSPNHSFIF